MTLKKENARQYPVSALPMLGRIMNELRKISEDYRYQIIEETSNQKEIVKFFDIKNPEFYFTVTFEKKLLITNYGEEYKDQLLAYVHPANEDTGGSEIFPTSESKIIKLFRGWVSILISYNNAINTFDPEDEIQIKYEEEFKDEFKLLDSDADKMPFGDDIQKKIYDFLSYVQMAVATIVNPNQTIIDLKKDIADFKEQISGLTKSKVVEKGAKIYGIFKKLSPIVRAEILKKSIDFGIKRIADGTALTMIEKFQDFILPK